MAIIFDGTQGITTPAETANNSVTTPIVKSSANLVFQSNGTTEAMRIDSSGNLNIGAPSNIFGSKLGITSSAAFPLAVITPTIAGTSLNKSTNGAGNHILMTSNNSFNYGVIGVTSADGTSTGDIFTLGYTPSGGAAATNVLNWSSAGRVTMPAQPCFLATRTSGNMTTSGQTVVFNSVQFNTGSHYNSSNGRFTAPIAGNYLFALSAITTTGALQSYLNLYKNNSFYGLSIYAGGPDGYYKNFSSSFILNLAAGDYIEFVVGTSTGLYAAGDGGNPRFSGCLLN